MSANSLSCQIKERKLFQSFAPQRKSSKVVKSRSKEKPFERLHSLANISKFKGFLVTEENTIAIFTSIMLHSKREIRDLIKRISTVNEHLFLNRLFEKNDVKFLIRRFKKRNSCSVSWRIRIIKSLLTCYLSAEKKGKRKSFTRIIKFKTNRFKVKLSSVARDYHIEFVPTFFSPFFFTLKEELVFFK